MFDMVGVLQKMSSQEIEEYRRLLNLFWQATDDLHFVEHRILVFENQDVDSLREIKNKALNNMKAFEELMKKLYFTDNHN